jgi:OmpA-OmpF porin, OOP family
MNTSRLLAGAGGLLVLVTLATPGCATKKFVRQQTSPIQERVDEIDKKHTAAVASLDSKEQKDISRVEERAMGAENRANEAGKAAQSADQKAQQAGDSARGAQQLAQTNQGKIGDLTNTVTNGFNSIDNFKQSTTEDVLFGFNKATLTPEGKQKLDQIAQQAKGMNRYVLEVQGYTDRSGSSDYNLALSRRRADTVVRYLVENGVPLRRVHMIGLGSEQAAMSGQPEAQPASGKMTRKEQRRVVVRVFVPETQLSASSTGQSATQTQPPARTSPSTQPEGGQTTP